MDKKKLMGVLFSKTVMAVVATYCIFIPIRWLLVMNNSGAGMFIGTTIVRIVFIISAGLIIRKKETKILDDIGNDRRKMLRIGMLGIVGMMVLYSFNVPQRIYGMLSSLAHIYEMEETNLLLVVCWEQMFGQQILLSIFICIVTVYIYIFQENGKRLSFDSLFRLMLQE